MTKAKPKEATLLARLREVRADLARLPAEQSRIVADLDKIGVSAYKVAKELGEPYPAMKHLWRMARAEGLIPAKVAKDA